MSTSVRTLLFLSFASALSSLALARTPKTRESLDLADRREDEPALQITVREVDFFGVPRATLFEAQAEAQSIFRKAGVEIRWLDCPPSPTDGHFDQACTPPPGVTYLYFRIVPSYKGRSRTLSRDLGCAFMQSEGLTAVFYDRVEELATRESISPGLVLGLAAVHEIGHLLLREVRHSSRGIMLPYWNPDDLNLATQGSLTFTRKQAERIRAEVRARVQEQRPVRLSTAKVPQ